MLHYASHEARQCLLIEQCSRSFLLPMSAQWAVPMPLPSVAESSFSEYSITLRAETQAETQPSYLVILLFFLLLVVILFPDTTLPCRLVQLKGTRDD